MNSNINMNINISINININMNMNMNININIIIIITDTSVKEGDPDVVRATLQLQLPPIGTHLATLSQQQLKTFYSTIAKQKNMDRVLEHLMNQVPQRQIIEDRQPTSTFPQFFW